ncbi:MAG: ABC transporter ATP-binding protein [Pyrinomonadaceae bacterium]
MSAVTSPFARLSGKPIDDTFWALKDISFEVYPGEVIGIIGRNGAGKSTLLRILARITKPTTGEIDIYGRLGSLLEIGTGFHGELTGRENIFLNGTILGMKIRETKRKFDDIVAFSGVERFLETPVKHYSSGMHLRLAFAIAAHFEPEVLLIDEIVAVGDLAFQKKCFEKLRDITNDGRTVFVVAHNLDSIQNLCDRVFLIRSGELCDEHDPTKAVAIYVAEQAQNGAGQAITVTAGEY